MPYYDLLLKMRFLNVFCSEFSAWADHIPSNFLKDVFHKFYLVHSWIICPISIWFLAPYGTILNHTSTFFYVLVALNATVKIFKRRQPTARGLWKLRVPEIYRKSLEDSCGGIHYLVKLKAIRVHLYWNWTPSQIFFRDFV